MPFNGFQHTHTYTHTHTCTLSFKEECDRHSTKASKYFDFDILSQLECVNEMTDKS